MKLIQMGTVTQQFKYVISDAQRIVDIFNEFAGREVAVIAGGCVRDYITGRKQPKDIDVIIEYTDNRDYDEVGILAHRMGYRVCDYGDNRYAEEQSEDADTQLKRVFKLDPVEQPFNSKGLTYEGHKLDIDIIFVNCTVEQRIASFPCNMSQFLIREGSVYGTAAAQWGLYNRIVDVYPNAPPFTESYAKRMEEYFPDWEHMRTEK